MDNLRLRRAIGLTLIVVALATVFVWAISQYVRPLLPASIESSSILFFAVLVSTIAVLAGFKDIVELVNIVGASLRTSDEKVRHNLPQPTYERFIGRQEQIRTIQALLLPTPESRHFVITIDGVGGVGKSALALEVAYSYLDNYKRLPKRERFQTIIWTTAKKEVLTGEGILPQHQRLHTLDDIYVAIADLLDRSDISTADRVRRGDLVRHALTQRRSLLIVDNLETIDDEAIKSFIREVPEPTKVIITSRHRLDVAYPIRLEGMEVDEAKEFVEDEEKKKGVELSPNQVTRLISRTGGVPLALVWSIAQMGLGHDPESVIERLGWATTDIAKFCFEGVVNLIRGKNPYKLLMAIAYIGKEADRQTLGHVSRLPPLDRDDSLVVLEQLSLVNKRGDTYFTLPLTLAYIKAELDGHPETVIEFNKTFLDDYLSQVAARYGLTRPFGSLNLRLVNNVYIPSTIYLSAAPSEDSSRVLDPSAALLQESPRGLGALELIEAVDRAFVLGPPGIGKTALLQYVALQAALGNLNLIPIFVRLGSLNESGASLIEYIASEFERVKFPASKEFATLLMTTGRALLLLDALDEVSQTNDRRQKLVYEVENLALAYPKCKILITSRAIAVTFIPTNFVLAEIVPFSDAQIESFVHAWFSSEPAMANSLIQALSNRRELRDLAGNPLTLSLLCSVYSAEVRLPTRLVDAYEAATQALLKSWDTSRNIRRDDILRQLTVKHKLQLFGLLATATFVNGKMMIDQRSLEVQIAEYLRNLPSFEGGTEIDGVAVLRALQAQYGLIVEQALGMYSFVTLGFEEYFTALHYSGKSGAAEELAKYLWDPRWRNVLAFFCGIHPNPALFLTLVQQELGQYLERQHLLRELVTAAKSTCREEGNTYFDDRWLCIKEKMLGSLPQNAESKPIADSLALYIAGCETFIKCLQEAALSDRSSFEESFLAA